MHTTENTPNKTPPDRMRAHRARLRAAGLRPVEIWVPDVRNPSIVREAGRQSLIAARHPAEMDALAFIEAAADIDEPEAYIRFVISRIADHPAKKIAELLPWNVKL